MNCDIKNFNSATLIMDLYDDFCIAYKKILCLDGWFKILTNEIKHLECQDNQIKVSAYHCISSLSL